MKTYNGAIAQIRKNQGRWAVLKMHCMSVWYGIESRFMPERSKARARALTGR